MTSIGRQDETAHTAISPEWHATPEGLVARRLPVPQLWTVFVLGWTPMLAVIAAAPLLTGDGPVRLVVTLLVLTLLGALYLWITLRGSFTTADLAPAGPGTALLRRRLLLLSAMSVLVIALVLLVPDAEMWWVGMHVIIAAGLALPTRLAAGITAGVVAFSLACAWLINDIFDIVLLLQLAFGAAAIAVRQLTIAVEQLREAREELARLAVAEERLRFARDLHDLLGHSLSMIVLKSELAGRLLPAAPERAAVEVGDVERAARDALREVRAAVSGYRQPGLADELAAARELLSAAGIVVSVEDRVGPLPPAIDGLLAWAVREGVTNVIHHSRAQHCAIRVSRNGRMARIEITDDGRGSGAGPSGSGSGLAGLAERAAVLKGSLHSGPMPVPEGGFRLMLEVPLAGEEDS